MNDMTSKAARREAAEGDCIAPIGSMMPVVLALLPT